MVCFRRFSNAVNDSARFCPGNRVNHQPVLFYRCFISLQHMIGIDLFMKPVIQDRKISIRTLDCPVCHNLTGEVDPVALQFLFLAV